MIIDDQIELNLFNNKDINNNENYCCICLNTYNYKFIKLECCNKDIHYECVIDWVITETNINYKCPICRKRIQLNNSITFGNIIDYIIIKKKMITTKKFDFLVNNLYNVNFLDIDSQSNNDNMIEIYNNKLKMLCLGILIISSIFVFFMYYSIFN